MIISTARFLWDRASVSTSRRRREGALPLRLPPPVPSERLLRPVVIEDYPDRGQAASTMTPALLAVLAAVRFLFRGWAALQAERFALRHQLLILERQRLGRRIPVG